MKTPVDGARISSGFGSRFHPILGYTRMHKGVDFAVHRHAGDGGRAGTIKFMGRASGYGNFVLSTMATSTPRLTAIFRALLPACARARACVRARSSPIAA